MLDLIDADKWIANVLDKYQAVKKSKKKPFWLRYETPFHLAALIGHLWLLAPFTIQEI